MSSATLRMLPPAGRLKRLQRAGGDAGSLRLIERHARVYRHAWLVFASGVFETLFYLLSVGLGLGVLVGKVPGPGGQPIPYREFVAPGLLAYVTPLWQGVNLCRMLSLGHLDPPVALVNVAYLAALTAAGIWAGARTYRRRLYV